MKIKNMETFLKALFLSKALEGTAQTLRELV